MQEISIPGLQGEAGRLGHTSYEGKTPARGPLPPRTVKTGGPVNGN